MILCFLVLFGLTFYIKFGECITRETTISIIADADAFAVEDSPDSNYGDWDVFRAGKFIMDYFFESYLHFNFSDKPINYIKAEISLFLMVGTEPVDISVCLINESWDELNITWNNKPTHEEVITTLTVSKSSFYTINITDYIEENDGISICLKAKNAIQKDYVLGYTREEYYRSKTEYASSLIWTYQETAEINVISPSSSSVLSDGELFTIRWNSNGSIDKVVIELYQGSQPIENITDIDYTDNNGDYDWIINSLKNYKGTNYRIKITDYDDENVYGYSNYFAINDWSGNGGNVVNGSIDNTFIFGLTIVGVIAIILIFGIGIIAKKRKTKSFLPEPIAVQQPQPTIPIKSFCPHCGIKLTGTETICSNCGAELE